MERNTHRFLSAHLMRLSFGLIIAVTSSALSHAQDSGKSFIIKKAYTEADGTKAYRQITYYDGLGRLEQTVCVDGGGTGIDVADLTEYDSCGRVWRTWLPVGVPNNNGFPVSRPRLLDNAESLYGDDARIWSETEYDGSPLDQVRSQAGPGEAWAQAGKRVHTSYLTNDDNDSLRCLRFYPVSPISDTLVTVRRDGVWDSGALTVVRTEDEDGRSVLVFTDFLGRTILTRQVNSTATRDNRYLDTYYIYDAGGRLLSVLPPLLLLALSGEDRQDFSSDTNVSMRRYGYFYGYDEKGRCIAKRLPGCGWARYIYDKGNRPVFSQDAENRRKGRWMFSFSDIHGRSCVSGYCEGDMETLKQAASAFNVVATRQENANGPYMGYSVSGLSLNAPVVLSVSYYDDYSFIDSQVPSEKRSFMNYNAEYGLSKWDHVHGLPTGGAERVLGDDITNDFQWSSCYYDKKGNLIQSHTTRKDGGVDVATTAVTFTGKPERVHISHNHGQSGELNEYYKYTYDNWERPLTVTHRMGESTDSTVLSDIKYDGIGRVKSDNRNGIPAMKTSFTYNVRSWTKSINGPGLSEVMSYEDGGQWGGNISGISWSAGPGTEEFSDTYDYDGLSRLINSTRYMTSEPSHKYINNYVYDEQSNIIQSTYKDEIAGSGLTPIGSGRGFNSRLIEKNYNHDGNRMVSGRIMTGSYDTNRNVSSADTYFQQVAYAYDRNGRLTLSEDQGMTEIQYNAVGYPSCVKMADGGEVVNTYTAGGTRLESRSSDIDKVVTTMAYEGNEVFENGDLRMLLFDGGYVDFSGNEPRYCWYTKDHLGSVRAVSDAEGNVFSTYAYGPYGEDFSLDELIGGNQGGGLHEFVPVTHDGVIPNLEHMSVYPGEPSQYSGISGPINGNVGSNQPTAPHSVAADSDWQPYKFSGKESLTRVGLDLYDFGARMYSPSNMRWMTIDPLAEKYYHISPYVYCAGNPLNLVDPDGMQWYLCTDSDGTEYKYYEGAMPDEERKKYQNVKYVGYTHLDKENNTYYSLFGEKCEWVDSNGKPAMGQIYEKIDQLLKTKKLSPDSKVSMYIPGLPTGVIRDLGKDCPLIYKGSTFTTIPVGSDEIIGLKDRGGEALWLGNMFWNNRDDTRPDLDTSLSSITEMPTMKSKYYKKVRYVHTLKFSNGYFLVANNYLGKRREGCSTLVLLFNGTQAKNFMNSYNNIFRGHPNNH